jgi:ABC-type phosphate transport system auxiliary subunit
MSKDLGEELENVESEIENLKNKEFRLFGIKMTPMTIGALFTAISTVLGMLYGGFLMYQKVENIAQFVDGAEEFNQRIELLDARLQKNEDSLKKTEDFMTKQLESQRNILNRTQTQIDRQADATFKMKDDVRSMISDAEARFELKRDTLRQSVQRDTKELEERLNNKIQRALDNPLAD